MDRPRHSSPTAAPTGPKARPPAEEGAAHERLLGDVLEADRYLSDIFMTPVIDTEGSDEALPGVVLRHRYKSGRLKAHEVIALISRGNSFGRYLPYPDPKPVRGKSRKASHRRPRT